MAVSDESLGRRRVDFGWGELTGAIGDSLTVLPLVVALALLTAVSLPHVLIAFGVFQIVWGVRYGLPVSVEPMKALAALAIAGVLSYAELAAAGLVLGVVLLGVGLTGTLARVQRYVGEPVIRGVQFAVGLLLLETGLSLAVESLAVSAVGVVIVTGVAMLGYRSASGLAVLATGLAVAVLAAGVPAPQWPGLPPTPEVGAALSWRLADGVFAQLAMTVGNAALATSLLFSDLLDADVSPDTLSTSMGVTNLLAIPAGGLPMCHGCDGVAGKHAFGARTGGSNVLLGVLYLGAAAFATTALLAAFPLALLGVLLVLVAASLASHVLESSNLALSAGIGALTLLTNLGVAFLVGIAVHLLASRARSQ